MVLNVKGKSDIFLLLGYASLCVMVIILRDADAKAWVRTGVRDI